MASYHSHREDIRAEKTERMGKGYSLAEQTGADPSECSHYNVVGGVPRSPGILSHRHTDRHIGHISNRGTIFVRIKLFRRSAAQRPDGSVFGCEQHPPSDPDPMYPAARRDVVVVQLWTDLNDGLVGPDRPGSQLVAHLEL